jgi:Arc/MetJ-type ribon-helix-helix transcriptional regulator
MSGLREPKKSETIEVRLPYKVKSALMNKARAEGRSASEVIRQSIDSYLAQQPKEARSMLLAVWKPAALIGAGSLALVFASISATPSQAKPDLRSAFQMLDRNHDGAITINEFLRDASDPAIEKMHQAHMKDAASHGGMGAMHGEMMQAAHDKTSQRALRAHFAELDANSDGSITFKEFEAFHDRMKASHSAN